MKNTGVALFRSLPLFFFAVQELVFAATLTFTNDCSYAVWPGILAYDQNVQLSTTGFELAIGASKSVNIPSPWSGRIWARTGCSKDSGVFVCVTGDCGSGQVECNGASASLPITIAELTTSSNSGDEFYHVSNEDGFNLPMSIAPEGGNGSCQSSDCPANITSVCPEELQVRWSDGSVIACKSACLALGLNTTADKCQPTRYSQFFERQCPDAYSYVHDGTRFNGNFTCSGGSNYTVTFCPPRPKGEAHGAIITFTNNCSETVWPALLSSDATSKEELTTTGFELKKGTSSFVDIPSSWTGRFWARTRCSSSSGNFTCATGDCLSGQVECNGSNLSTPATLVELAKRSSAGPDFYDVSYVDGFNLPISIAPEGGNGDCKPASCPGNLTSSCPTELQMRGSDGNIIACMSACTAFNQPQYCCVGDFTGEKCVPTGYAQFFKRQCPHAYSYPYDDKTGAFNCSGGPNYIITFCP